LLPTSISNPVRTALAPQLSTLSPEGRSLQVIRAELHSRFGERRLRWLNARSEAMHDLGRKLHEDVFQFSLPCLLRYADRNSMAFSIESRMPLLDYRLAEHVFSLPLPMIMRDGWTKWVFRRAMEGHLPREIQWRKDKKGFVTPEGGWLRAGKQRLAEVLSGDMVSGDYLDAAKISSQLDRFVDATRDTVLYTDMFRWYIVELWMRYAFGATSAVAAISDDHLDGDAIHEVVDA